MKILLINQFCSHGSTGRICTDLQELAIANGDECCIAYGRYSAPEGIETYKVGSSFNVYEHVFESRFYDNDGFASRHSTRKFVKFIKEYNPDVIHIHNLHGYYVNSEILMDYLKKRVLELFGRSMIAGRFHPEQHISITMKMVIYRRDKRVRKVKISILSHILIYMTTI